VLLDAWSQRFDRKTLLNTTDEKDCALCPCLDTGISLLQQQGRREHDHGGEAKKPPLVVQQKERQAHKEDKTCQDEELGGAISSILS